MQTIIELYDERPIENVLGAEVFRPKELVILCPAEVESTNVLAKSLRKYFEHRGCPIKVTVVPVSLLDAKKVEKQLRRVIETREDCVIDISGGTDAALFAAGCVDPDVPVITYSRKKNTFFEIRNAPYARNLPCNVHLDAESCFLDRPALFRFQKVPQDLEPADLLYSADLLVRARRAHGGRRTHGQVRPGERDSGGGASAGPCR